MVTLLVETEGEIFLKKLELAQKNKTTLFAFLYQTVENAARNSRRENKTSAGEKKEQPSPFSFEGISDLDEMVSYHGALAELQIKRNASAINRSVQQLDSLRNLGKKSNFDYEAIMQKKIAVLASLKPEPREYIYIAMQRYVKEMAYGSAKDFKREFREFVRSRSMPSLAQMMGKAAEMS